MLTDLHVHLRPDDVSDSPPERYFTQENAEAYRSAASDRGIEELGVSEHVYRFTEALDVWQHDLWRASAHDDLAEYCAFVRDQTDLKLGIEADFIPGTEDRMRELLEAHDFDYVVGSIHFVGDGALDHEQYDIWGGFSSPDKIWRTYFEWLGEAAMSGLFDILAHPDLVKYWGPKRRPWPEKELRYYYEIAMEGIAESGIAVEVSTAGLRKPVGELYPARALLELVLEAGNPIVLSSDAHTPQDIGRDYDQALAVLDELGVTELATFERRRRRTAPIGAA